MNFSIWIHFSCEPMGADLSTWKINLQKHEASMKTLLRNWAESVAKIMKYFHKLWSYCSESCGLLLLFFLGDCHTMNERGRHMNTTLYVTVPHCWRKQQLIATNINSCPHWLLASLDRFLVYERFQKEILETIWNSVTLGRWQGSSGKLVAGTFRWTPEWQT